MSAKSIVKHRGTFSSLCMIVIISEKKQRSGPKGVVKVYSRTPRALGTFVRPVYDEAKIHALSKRLQTTVPHDTSTR